MDLFAILKLIGGLGLFLYGMKLMAEGLEKAAGSKLRRGLEVLTTNRFSGAALGTGVTALIQSSSATSVMVVGFVNAGLLTLTQATGVLMGATLGTTVTAWIISIDLKDIAPIFVFIGVIMMLFFKKRSIKRVGAIVLGFGILFVGLDLMSGAMAPLKEMQEFQNFLVSFKNPIIGILIGILVTAVIQSSSASIGILAGLAIAGAIDLPLAVYVILGANVGTCITALLACIGSSKAAKRTAFIFLFYNIIKVTMFAVIIQFVPIVDWLVASGMEVKMQIAVFHTLINAFALIVLIWAPQFLIKLSMLVVRGEEDETRQKRFQYIGEKMLDTPAIAVGQSLKEVGRMAEMAKENYELSMQSLIELDEAKATKVLEQEQVVNFLNHEITDFLARLSALELATKDALIVADLFHIVNDIERISDHAENIAEFTMTRIDDKVPFTKGAVDEIMQMNDYVLQALEACVLAFENNDDEMAHEVIRLEKIVDELEETLKQSHVKRISNGKCTARASMIFSDLINNLERVSDHATNIAYYVLKSDYR